jgi:uncharacterized protein
VSRQVFINIPVSNLASSTVFYDALGFQKNPQFSDETAACMVWSETIFVMLLSHDKFKMFTPRPLADAHNSIQVLFALSLDDRSAVDRFSQIAAKHGGKDHRAPQDLGFMYSRSVEDPDGHTWEPFFMDTSAMSGAPAA